MYRKLEATDHHNKEIEQITPISKVLVTPESKHLNNHLYQEDHKKHYIQMLNHKCRFVIAGITVQRKHKCVHDNANSDEHFKSIGFYEIISAAVNFVFLGSFL